MYKEFLECDDVLYTAIIINEEKTIHGCPIHMTLNFNKQSPKESDLGVTFSLKVIAEGDYFNDKEELENSGLLIDKEEFLKNYPQLKYLIIPEDKELTITTHLEKRCSASNTILCDFEDVEPYGIKGKLAVLDKKGNYSFKIVHNDNLRESVLNEVRRSQLLSVSRKGIEYANGGSRWDSKSNCKVANTVQDYNKIDMNSLWKDDKLKFVVKIQGETDQYFVTIQFSNLLVKIKRYVQQAKNKFDRESVTRALMDAIDSSDILVDCNCPDFKYRLSYWASKNGFKAGEKETRPTEITNPLNNRGALCKHILAALNNASWIRNVASVIVNYANYCKDNLEYNYSRFIFPKIFGLDYNKAIQMCLDDYNENGEVDDNLKSDEATINLSNFIAKKRFNKKLTQQTNNNVKKDDKENKEEKDEQNTNKEEKK